MVLGANMRVRPMLKRILKTVVDICLDQERKIANLERTNATLEKRNELLLRLLRDVESFIDTGDQQQISVGIKRWRHEVNREGLLKSNIRPGLVRE